MFLALIMLVPDLVVCWAAARLTESGWKGFLIAAVALVAVNVFLWLKTAGWSWIVFWIYNKDRMTAQFAKWFIADRYPSPNLSEGFRFYLREIINTEEVDARARIKAAEELGLLSGLDIAAKFSATFQIESAARVAMERYYQTLPKNPHSSTANECKH